MFAQIRESTFHPGVEEQRRAPLEEFAALRAQQPGYRGAASIDAGDGRLVTVTFWESEAAAAATVAVLRPQADRLLGALWSSRSEVVYQGPVVSEDLPAR